MPIGRQVRDCHQFMSNRVNESIVQQLKQLSREIRELDLGEAVDTIQVPDPITFLAEYVASNKPVLIKDAIAHWPALQAWNREYLAAKAGELHVSVDVTANGYGDAVTPYTTKDGLTSFCFCIPDKRHVLFKEFLNNIFQQQNAEVPYLQVCHRYAAQKLRNLPVAAPVHPSML